MTDGSQMVVTPRRFPVQSHYFIDVSRVQHFISDSKGRWFESSRVRTQKSPQNRQIMTILRVFVCDVELWMFVLFAMFAQMVVKW